MPTCTPLVKLRPRPLSCFGLDYKFLQSPACFVESCVFLAVCYPDLSVSKLLVVVKSVRWENRYAKFLQKMVGELLSVFEFRGRVYENVVGAFGSMILKLTMV